MAGVVEYVAGLPTALNIAKTLFGCAKKTTPYFGVLLHFRRPTPECELET